MRMLDKIQVSMADGTLVRHKTNGYEGKIDDITEIKACFTRGGALLATPLTKEPFQYRVVVAGESMRHIAPAEDLEILEPKMAKSVPIAKQTENPQVARKKKRKQVRHFEVAPDDCNTLKPFLHREVLGPIQPETAR